MSANLSTVLRIARHEWQILASENASWVIVFLLGIAVGYAVTNGIFWVNRQQTTIHQALAQEAQRYARLKQQVTDIEAGRSAVPVVDPRMPDAAGRQLAWRYAVMPPQPLSALSIGQSDLLPPYFKVSTLSRESVLTTNEIENPQRLLQGRLDLSFVVIYLFPLLIIALGHNVISLEREQGTLALLLSQPVAPRAVIATKIAVRVGLVLAFIIMFAVLATVVGGIDVARPGIATRLCLWISIVGAYGAFWFGAVALVTSFGRGSAANALALTAIWVVLVVVTPSAMSMVVSTAYPMPSRVGMIAAVRMAMRDASSQGDSLLARYYGDHPELVSVSDVEKVNADVAVTQLAIDDAVEQQIRPVVERRDTQLARQRNAIDRFRLLSPAIVAQDALNDVAGTGTERYQRFVSLVSAFHEGWQALFTSMIVSRQHMTAQTYDALPRFKYTEEPFNLLLSRVAVAVSTLVGAGILLATVGLLRLRDYGSLLA